MKSIKFGFLLSCFVFVSVQAFEIDKNFLHLQSFSDEWVSFSIQIRNANEVSENVQFKVYAWKLNESDQIETAAVPSLNILYPHQLIRIQAKEEIEIPIMVKAPADHRKSIPLLFRVKSDQATHDFKFILSPMAAIEKIQMMDWDYEWKDDSLKLYFLLKNQGEIFSRVYGYLAVIDEQGLVIGQKQLFSTDFPPQKSRFFSMDVPVRKPSEGQNVFKLVLFSDLNSHQLLKARYPLLKQKSELVKMQEKKVSSPPQILNPVRVTQNSNLNLKLNSNKWLIEKVNMKIKPFKLFVKVSNLDQVEIFPQVFFEIFNTKKRNKVAQGSMATRKISPGYSELFQKNENYDLVSGDYRVQLILLYKNTKKIQSFDISVK